MNKPQAINYAQQAAELATDDQAAFRMEYALVLLLRFKNKQYRGDLKKAIDQLALAVSLEPDSFIYEFNLGLSQVDRFYVERSYHDLLAGISHMASALDKVPASETVYRAQIYATLASALNAKFAHTHRLDDLDELIEAARNSLDLIAASNDNYTSWASNYVAALMTRFRLTADFRDADLAIRLGSKVVRQTLPEDPEKPGRLMNLGMAHLRRFEHLGESNDLDSAIEFLEQAAKLARLDDPERTGMLSIHASALLIRAEKDTRSNDGFQNALAVAEQAVESVPSGQPDSLVPLSTVGGIRLRLFSRTGDIADLDKAVEAFNAALAAGQPDNPDLGSVLGNLAESLSTRFSVTHNSNDFDRSLTYARWAIHATPASHPAQVVLLTLHARRLWARYGAEGVANDRNEALDCLDRASKVLAAPPYERLRAAKLFAVWSWNSNQIASALAGYSTALELISHVAWQGLSASTRLNFLSSTSTIARDGAACAIELAGVADGDRRSEVRPDSNSIAVAILEAGRAILWTQTIDLQRDFNLLAMRKPTLAARLQALGHALAEDVFL